MRREEGLGVWLYLTETANRTAREQSERDGHMVSSNCTLVGWVMGMRGGWAGGFHNPGGTKGCVAAQRYYRTLAERSTGTGEL